MKINLKFQKFGENPNYDWHFLLVCFALIVSAALGINTYFYISLRDADSVATLADSSVETLNSKDAEEVMKALSDRKLDAQNIPPVVYSDPSL